MEGESEIEIRQVFEAEDFGEAFTPELREQEERLRAVEKRGPLRTATQTRGLARWRLGACESARRDDVIGPCRRTEMQRAIEAVWRIEAPKLIAGLARIVRDVGLAEDLAQDALVSALEQWPAAGVPRNPGAWLMAAAKHRAIDQLPPAQAARAEARGAGPRAGGAADRRPARSRCRAWTMTSATICCG